MALTRRGFVRCLPAVLACPFAAKTASVRLIAAQASGDDPNKKLLGVWQLQSYTYTSNNKTYAVPEDMEATARFTDGRYETDWSTYIRMLGYKRTRKASEKGTYSVADNRIRLLGEEASQDNEKGEEFLADVTLNGDTMTLGSNNGANKEVWKKVG